MIRARTLVPMVLASLAGLAVLPSLKTPAPPPGLAQDESSDEEAEARMEKKVRELLELTGVPKSGKRMMRSIMESMRQVLRQGEEDPELDAHLEAFVERVDVKELVDLMVPVYARNMDEETLDAAIEFFGSPLGQRFAEQQLQITLESAQISMQWAKKISEEMRRELEDR